MQGFKIGMSSFSDTRSGDNMDLPLAGNQKFLIDEHQNIDEMMI